MCQFIKRWWIDFAIALMLILLIGGAVAFVTLPGLIFQAYRERVAALYHVELMICTYKSRFGEVPQSWMELSKMTDAINDASQTLGGLKPLVAIDFELLACLEDGRCGNAEELIIQSTLVSDDAHPTKTEIDVNNRIRRCLEHLRPD